MLPVAILAGGRATRLGELAADRPKSLVEVAGRPFLHHQLELLARRGVRDVVLCLGHLGGMIRDRLNDAAPPGLRLRTSDDGPAPLGTGGALRRALPLLGPAFFVLYGDSYLPADYAAVEQAWRQSARAGLMTLYRNDGTLAPSNLEFHAGKIIAYDKAAPSPAMHHIDYGLGLLTAPALRDYPDGANFDLAEVYQKLIQQGELAGLEMNERFYEIGSRCGLADLERHLR